jgi:hypothetical protein
MLLNAFVGFYLSVTWVSRALIQEHGNLFMKILLNLTRMRSAISLPLILASYG